MPSAGEWMFWVVGLIATTTIGVISYYLKRERQQQDKQNAAMLEAVNRIAKDMDASIEKLRQELAEAQANNERRIHQVEQKLNDFMEAAPYRFTLREDFIRILANVERKLDQLMYYIRRDKEGEA